MENSRIPDALPEPVSPDLYTREYFTTDCEGYDLLGEGSGGLPQRILEALDAAGNLAGKWVLDIGCGRGELACEAATRGAYAVGIDYSDAAIALSRERLEAMGKAVRDRVEFARADAKGLSFAGGSFDVVFLVDVYEHLYPHEIAHSLGEIKRVLRPGGVLVVHTGPNTWFYRYGYPLVRWAARTVLRRELPGDLRGQYDDVMHVNEQSPASLYRGLKEAGFEAMVLPRTFLAGINPSRWERAVMRLLFAPPLGFFFCTSLMAVARPHEGGGEANLRVNRMLRMLNAPRGSRVLLVGEREGMLARRLRDLAGVAVTWLEPAPDTREMRTGGSRNGDGAIEFLEGDPANLPFPDGSFDAVAAQFTLDHAEDPLTALREWARVLRRGGALALAARNALYHGMEVRPVARSRNALTPDALRELVNAAGFEACGVSTLIPDLKLPALYRGDLGFSLRLERMPYFSKRGRLLFLHARRKEA